MKMIQTFNSGVMDENLEIYITLINDMGRIKPPSERSGPLPSPPYLHPGGPGAAPPAPMFGKA
jgi:hypothetical protein